MTADLPPVGARVRTMFGAEGTVQTGPRYDPRPTQRHPFRNVATVYVVWDKDGRRTGGGMWVTADEIAEVLGEAPDAG